MNGRSEMNTNYRKIEPVNHMDSTIAVLMNGRS
jgi:hypothetical protein